MEKLLLVENLPIVIAGIRYLLGKDTDLEVDTARSFAEMQAKLTEKTYGVAMVGLNLDDKLMKSLLETVEQLPSTSVIIFANNAATLPEVELYQTKLCGILDKSESETEILLAIKQARKGQKYIGQRLLKELISQSGENKINTFGNLTAREKEIARMLANGKKNIQICKALELKPSTISIFKYKIFKKLKVETIAELKLFRQSFH